ncbi:hypothetical protein CF328_g7525 [Tilletia controversa]|nr:hypothetical protein CF328_g7525 [Tilletia controversa]
MDILGANAKYASLQGYITEAEHRQKAYALQAQREVALLAHQDSPWPNGGRQSNSNSNDQGNDNGHNKGSTERCGYCKKKGHTEAVFRIKERHKEEDKDVSDRAKHAYTGRDMDETIDMGQNNESTNDWTPWWYGWPPLSTGPPGPTPSLRAHLLPRSRRRFQSPPPTNLQSTRPPRIRRALTLPPPPLPDNFGPGFDGKPSELEAFLSRIRDVARSDHRDAWQSAVFRALPLVLKGDAAAWHESLPDAESDALTSVSLWIETLRLAFPVNISALGTEAHDRAWRPALESASEYYYQKLRLLRHAWGFDSSEERLVADIRTGFSPIFRVMLHVPNKGATLDTLRLQIAAYEPEWELMYPALKTPVATPTPVVPKIASVKSTASSLWTPPAMARSASAPQKKAPPAAAQSSPRTPTSALGLAGTYDPSRITPAANGKKQVYRRPDTNEPMELNRPCSRCGQDHFKFEHSYLVLSPAQLRMLEVWPGDDDYPVLYTGEAQTRNAGEGCGVRCENREEITPRPAVPQVPIRKRPPGEDDGVVTRRRAHCLCFARGGEQNLGLRRSSSNLQSKSMEHIKQTAIWQFRSFGPGGFQLVRNDSKLQHVPGAINALRPPPHPPDGVEVFAAVRPESESGREKNFVEDAGPLFPLSDHPPLHQTRAWHCARRVKFHTP